MGRGPARPGLRPAALLAGFVGDRVLLRAGGRDASGVFLAVLAGALLGVLAEKADHPHGAAEAGFARDRADLQAAAHEQALGVLDAAGVDFLEDRAAELLLEARLQPPQRQVRARRDLPQAD